MSKRSARKPNADPTPWWMRPHRHGDVDVVKGVPYRFDARAADRVIDFFHMFLRHGKDPFHGQPFKLEVWQIRMLRTLFGWKHPDGTRRYRKMFLFIPRKNGKTTLAAGIALYMLTADGTFGAEVYVAACDREQAKQTFDESASMVAQSPELSSMLQVWKSSIVAPETMSKFVVLTGGAGGKHGRNATCVIVDELHAHKDRAMLDVLTTSMGTRLQPLTVITTTAGSDQHGVGFEQYSYARKVRDGIHVDPRFLAVMFEAPRDADWKDPKVWRAVNPNLGVSVREDWFREQFEHAERVPGFENTFKTLHLNMWVSQETRWLPMDAWVKCAGPDRTLAWWKSLRCRKCYAGVDLAATQDLNAIVGVFPDGSEGYDVIARYFVPEGTLERRTKNDGVPYLEWAREGWVEATPGEASDQQAMRRALQEWHAMYQLVDIAVDRWEASRLIAELESDGLNAFEVNMSIKQMTAPSKELERVLIERRMRHGGHPVLAWNADNVALQVDDLGNYRPSKKKSAERIDGIVALILGLSRAMLHDTQARNPYSTASGKRLLILK